MKKAIALVISMTLIGCASVKPVPVETQVVERPPLNSIQTQEIGNTLVEYFVSSTMPGIRILSQFKMGAFTFDPQTPRPTGMGEKVERYLLEETSGDPRLAMNACFDPADSIFFPPNGYGVCDFLMKKLWGAAARTEQAKFIDIRKPLFRQELIYNGKVGSNIKFLYRELYGDMMRAPFNQEVQYDLAEGNVIGFKGARVEVISSTNRAIQYRVLKGFDR